MKTLIGIPCMDMVSTSFMTSLTGLEPVGDTELCVVQSSLIYDARNSICRHAIDGGFDRILWFDSDMVFAPSTMQRLAAHLDDGKEFVSGLYFTRREPYTPTIFKDIQVNEVDGKKIPKAVECSDYAQNSLIEIEACGFGCVMMTTDLAKRIHETFGLPFSPVLGFGEDISFCIRARKLGVPLYCDTSIKLGHVGYHMIQEDNFLAWKGAQNADKAEG